MIGIRIAIQDLSLELPDSFKDTHFTDSEITNPTWGDFGNLQLAKYGSIVQKQHIETKEVYNIIEMGFPSYVSGEMGSLKYLADRDEILFFNSLAEMREVLENIPVLEEE